MLRAFILVLLLSVTQQLSIGQCVHEGGPHLDFDQEAYDKHMRAFAQGKKLKKLEQVGLTVHIVESVQGASGLSSDNIQNIIKTINRAFSESGIEFFLCGAPRFVAGEDSYSEVQSDELNSREHESNTINIYLVQDYITDGLGFGGFAYFPWALTPRDRYITLIYNTSAISGILAHELGHFYGLYHTHDIRFGPELADGSNCSIAGDLLCDTPADYNLFFGGLAGCNYVADVKDSNGIPYNPDPSNIMSYAPHSCLKSITSEQAARMNFFHLTDNNYLISECTFPDFIISSEETNRVIRADENLNLSYKLDLISLEDQDQIEVYFWLSDDPNNLGTIIQKNSVSFDIANSYDLNFELDFPINRSTGTYYLTVQVDPELKVVEQEESNNLHQIVVTVDNSKLGDELIFANPTGDYLKLFLRSNSNIKSDLVISIWDHVGRLYHQAEVFKNRDEYFEEIDVSHLNSGLYILEAYFPEKGRSQAFNFYKS